jgi:hypothetical protein
MSAAPNRNRARPQEAQTCAPSHLAAVAPSACWPASRICCLLPQSGDEVKGTNAFCLRKRPPAPCSEAVTYLKASSPFKG